LKKNQNVLLLTFIGF